MSDEDYEKSVHYTLAKGRFQRWSEIYGRLVTLIVLFGGLLPFMDRFSKDLAGEFFSIMYVQGLMFCSWRCSSFLHGESSHRSLFHVWS